MNLLTLAFRIYKGIKYKQGFNYVRSSDIPFVIVRQREGASYHQL